MSGRAACKVDPIADGSTRQRRYAITVGPPPEPREIRRTAIAEQRTRVGFLHEVERDCAPIRFAEIRIIEPPRGGEADIEPWTDHPGYARDSLRITMKRRFDPGDPYFDALTRQWLEGTRKVFRELPPLEW